MKDVIEFNKKLVEDCIETNKKLVEKYPFLLPRNTVAGQSEDDYDYSYTELDNLPIGWRIAFGRKMCDEILDEVLRSNTLNEYRILDIKEKYGQLRWYDFGGSVNLCRIISKYEKLSLEVCICCGEQAEGRHRGVPMCKKCMEKLIGRKRRDT